MLIFSLPLAFIAFLIRAFAGQYLYMAFLVPLGAPELTVSQLIGISCTWYVIAKMKAPEGNWWKEKDETTQARSIASSVLIIVASLMTMGIGWICLHIH